MSAPIVLFTLSALTIILALIFRNDVRGASVLASAGALACALFVLLIPIDQPIEMFGVAFKFEPAWQLLGRALVLDQATQPMVGFLYLSGSFLLLPSWLALGSRHFPSLALAMLTVAGATLMANPFLYAAIFIEFTAFGGALILASRRSPRNLGALRLLTLYTLGMLIILITGWVLDQGSITSATTEMANRATLMLISGIAVLILIPPFHIWLINGSQEANPYSLSFVVLTLQSAALFFLFRFLDFYPWLRQNEFTFEALKIGGLFCLAVGVLFAVSQNDLRKVLAYIVVADIGFTLLAIGSSTSSGYRLALGMTASRIVSLGVLSIGLSTLLKESRTGELIGEDSPTNSWSRLAVFVGMLSLCGFPLTAGFPGRWSLLTILMEASPIAYFAFAAYSALCIMTVWWGYKLFQVSAEVNWLRVNAENLFLAFGVLIVMLLGIFPQLTYPWVVDLVAGLERLFG